ncbi:unnamed protein product [Paramecium octaurelia]|uniref:Uncharacterized protein n=1 Tax=Paramecium octaurelia TaxID=43137 RepID=A0A8S1XPP4_PAROT|nr:unnamed protein product [Paramecium octaurelia]
MLQGQSSQYTYSSIQRRKCTTRRRQNFAEKCISALTLTNLHLTSNEEIQQLQKLISNNKAITIDGISDTFIRKKNQTVKKLFGMIILANQQIYWSSLCSPTEQGISRNPLKIDLSQYLAHYSNFQNQDFKKIQDFASRIQNMNKMASYLIKEHKQLQRNWLPSQAV